MKRNQKHAGVDKTLLRTQVFNIKKWRAREERLEVEDLVLVARSPTVRPNLRADANENF